MLEYSFFFRKHGIRKPDQLVSPILSNLDVLDFPKKSIFHFTSEDPTLIGPDENEFLFRRISKVISLDHVLENGDNKGNPRRIPLNVEALIRSHRVKNKRYRRMMNLEMAAKDNLALIVYSYTLLPRLYRYMRSIYTDYNRWWNQESALWKNIGNIVDKTDRQHFVLFKLPKILPSIPDLRIGTGELNQRIIQLFNTPESRLILEIWKWLGEERSNSMLNHIPRQYFDRVNLIFEESGKWVVYNLGLLDEWRIATDAEVAKMLEEGANPKDIKDAKKGTNPEQLQRRFLKSLMVLFEARTVTVSEVDVQEKKAEVPPEEKPTLTTQSTQLVSSVGIQSNKTQIKTSDQKIDIETNLEEEKSPLPENIDEILEEEFKELEAISKRAKEVEFSEEENITQDQPVRISSPIKVSENLEDSVINTCKELAENGLLSPAEVKRHERLSQSYKNLKAPDGKRTIEDFIKVTLEELEIKESPKIPDIPTVIDKSMLSSSLIDFDRRYVSEVLERHVAGSVFAIQNAAISVTNYEVERIDDVMGSFNSYTVKLVPVDGVPSTLRFQLPVVNEDGYYVANGVKYRLRKQNGDLPIRKIAPDEVALTSYYGKIFVKRCNKRVYNYPAWLKEQITLRGLDPEDTTIMDLQSGNVFDSANKYPIVYSSLAMVFRSFKMTPESYPRTTGPMTFDVIFDQKTIRDLIGIERVAEYQKKGFTVAGQSDRNYCLLIDEENNFYVDNGKNPIFPIGTIESLLKLDSFKAPKEFAELRVLGKNIPIGLIFAYQMGLSDLLEKLNATVRRVKVGTRVNLTSEEYALVFDDETLVFLKKDKFVTMIMAGFLDYREIIRSYSVYDFDNKDVYLNVLESKKIGIRYLREIDLLYQMFIDPITKELLVWMKEPTDFHGLLMRSCELLMSDDHPNEVDPAFMRKKGYERFAGAVYAELVRSVRAHRSRNDKSRNPIELKPYSIWNSISQDPSKILLSEINPIQNLKEIESVTFGGTGGRNSRSMVRSTRIYHPNDMGTISESTVDSSDVGINTYTSANPQFVSLLGISKRYDPNKDGATSLLSTSALLAPGSDRDDPKRVNFVSIQNSHIVACKGYKPPMVRTGYEQVVAHRTNDLFAYSARKPGKVIEVSNDGIIIEYEDGERRGIELGRRYGSAAGLTIPHEVITMMKPGQKFKEGDIISYNPSFFEPDFLNPSNVVLKTGVVVKVALMESSKTFEDSSTISKKASELLTTKITYVRTIVVNFKDSVRKLVKVGTNLNPEDILCIVEDPVTANSEVFDEETIDTLRMLSAQAPKAKYSGVVERIQVFYHGSKEDMSDNLAEISTISDRELSRRNRAAGKKAFTGEVDDSFRIEGDSLPIDTLAIQIYITATVAAGTGDKGVFANQLKTVFCDVYEQPIVTESGVTIDGIFGQKSIDDRIVNSPDIIGTTNTLLKVIGAKAVAAYKNIK